MRVFHLVAALAIAVAPIATSPAQERPHAPAERARDQAPGYYRVLLGNFTVIIHAAEIQFPQPAVTIDFDADEPLAAKTRKGALAELARTHELVAAPHISFPGLGHVVRSGSGYAWAPLPYSSRVRQVGQ